VRTKKYLIKVLNVKIYWKV